MVMVNSIMFFGRFIFVSSLILSISSVYGNYLDKTVGLVIGTRPEAIKVIPLYLEFLKQGYKAEIIFTGQHREMVQDIFKLFDVEPVVDFNVMKSGSDLSYLTKAILDRSYSFFSKGNFSSIVVQGDTVSAFAAALGAFYLNIPIIHLEAGLRSYKINYPFPEEAYRQMISRIASLNLVPTNLSKENLIKEGISPLSIYVTGNTVVDSLRLIGQKLESRNIFSNSKVVEFFRKKAVHNYKTILLTAHRRESLNHGLEEVFFSIKAILEKDPTIAVIYPIHPNPQIRTIFDKVFPQIPERFLVCEPLIYNDLVYVLQHIDWVLTDSGGIQEEAVSLNKPTLVLRNETDRPEAIIYQKARLVGLDKDKILEGLNWLKCQSIQADQKPSFIYGDGYSAAAALDAIKDFIKKE